MIPPRPSPRGFTLVELMVAMTLGMTVLVVAVAMLNRASADYTRIGGGVSAERESRAVLTQLTTDLNAAVFHKQQILEKSTKDWPQDRLGIFCLQPDDAQSTAGRMGDLCAVQYYLKDLTIRGRTVRCLMRGFRESKDTFEALRTDATPSLFTPNPRDEPVAFGVISFQVRPKIRTDDGHWQDPTDPLSPPEAIDLRLVIARPELFGQLKTSAAWDGQGAATKLTGTAATATSNRYLEVYSTLIRFGHHDPL